MSFSIPGGYVSGTKVSSAWLNLVAATLSTTIDPVGAGVYNIGAGNTLSFPAGGGDIDFGAAFTATDILIAKWNSGSATFESGSFAEFKGGSSMLLDSAATVFMLAGSLLSVAANAAITIGGTLGNEGKLNLGAHAQIVATSGSQVTGTLEVAGSLNLSGATVVGAAASLAVAGKLQVTKTIASSADAGDDNVILAESITKAWGCVSTDGANGVTMAGGSNVQAPTFTGTQFVNVLFARPVADPNYAVAFAPICTSGNAMLTPALVDGTASTSGFQFCVFKDNIVTIDQIDL
jgi:hypothetical protein